MERVASWLERRRFVIGPPLWLRTIDIARGPVVQLLEEQLGRAVTHEFRHYLAGEPVNWGDIIELLHHGT